MNALRRIRFRLKFIFKISLLEFDWNVPLQRTLHFIFILFSMLELHHTISTLYYIHIQFIRICITSQEHFRYICCTQKKNYDQLTLFFCQIGNWYICTFNFNQYKSNNRISLAFFKKVFVKLNLANTALSKQIPFKNS